METIKQKFIQAIYDDNNIKIIKFLHKKYPNECFEIYVKFILEGNKHLIEWLYNHDYRINLSLTLQLSLLSGHSDIVSLIIEDYRHNPGSLETGCICVHDCAFVEACQQDNLNLYNCLKKYGNPNPDALSKCIQIAKNIDLINQLCHDQKKLDGPSEISKGRRGTRGCIGSNSLCISVDKLYSEYIKSGKISLLIEKILN